MPLLDRNIGHKKLSRSGHGIHCAMFLRYTTFLAFYCETIVVSADAIQSESLT